MFFTQFRLSVTALLLGGVAVAVAQTPPPSTMPTTGPTSAPVAITWEQAAKHIGETATVTGPVMSTYAIEEGHLILNVGKDYPEPDRFSIFMTIPANAPDADATYAGKTVTVSGKIGTGQDVTEVRVNAADVIVKK